MGIADELWQVGASTGEVMAVTIGTMCTILEDSHRSLKRIGTVDQFKFTANDSNQ